MSEPVTNIEGITASLDELVKAADATEVIEKAYGGVNIDHNDITDERGKVAGRMPGGGDIGSIDRMMIAKMAAHLSEGGYSDDQIAGFMTAFASDEDEYEEEEDDETVDGGEIEVEKSMRSYRSDPDISDAIDVSPFLEALTARTAEQLDDIRKSMGHSSSNQTNVNRAQAGAIYQIGTLVKGMSEVMGALNDRLNLVESTPLPQRGITGATALHKALPGEAGVSQKDLSKSDVLGTLSYMNLEKGIKDIGGRKTSDIIGMFEGGNVLDQTTLDAVRGFLSANPAEEITARQYR